MSMSPRRLRADRVGIQDVATAAGVSIATVSNALNSTGRLSEATRDRVIIAANRLGYRPMMAARAMAGTRTGLLGLSLATYGATAVPYTRIPYYAESILSATEAAHARGYLLLVVPGTSDAATWGAIAMDGVVHAEPRRDDTVRAMLLERGLPRVSDGRPFDADPDECWVDNDHESALVKVLDHLWHAGATRIGMMVPLHDDFFAVSLAATYRAWCTSRRQPVLAEPFAPHEYGSERAAARRLLTRRGRADAIFGVYNYSGHEALAAAAELGLAVPGDILVACFSEDPSYEATDPPITTLSLQPRLVSAAAVDLLIDLVEGVPVIDRQRLIPTILHIRRSTTSN